MPWPNVNPEFETLFEPTRILLFRKRFRSIRYFPEELWVDASTSEAADDVAKGAPDATRAPQSEPQRRANEFTTLPRKDEMPPGRLERKLRRAVQSFSRIYSFSYEGAYYQIPRSL